MSSQLIKLELDWAKEAGTAWYRSKETVPIHDPFVGGGFLSNKKWPLIEECTLLTIITVWTLILHKGQLRKQTKLPLMLKFPHPT